MQVAFSATMNKEDQAFAKHFGKNTDLKLHSITNGVKSHKNGVEQNGKLGPKHCEEFEPTPAWVAVMTYFGLYILTLFGYLRDFMLYYGLEKSRAFKERGNEVCYMERTSEKYHYV